MEVYDIFFPLGIICLVAAGALVMFIQFTKKDLGIGEDFRKPVKQRDRRISIIAGILCVMFFLFSFLGIYLREMT